MASSSVRLPAEWEPQSAIWMAWPRDPLTWVDHMEGARDAYLQCIEAVSPQRVDLIVHPDLRDGLAAATADMGHVALHAVEHVDSWLRDTMPLTVETPDGERAVKFRFDAWGGKYDQHARDDALPDALRKHLPPMHRVDVELEGGAIETDGQDTVLTTEQCLIDSRPPAPGTNGDAHGAWEELLREELGTKHVVWLAGGLGGDDTDGHVDTIARFVAPGKVLACSTRPGHPDHDILQENLARLRQATDARGRTLEVIPVPLPPQRKSDDGRPLPASHLNFLVTNHVVLVPTFGGLSDDIALHTLQTAYPDRRVVSIPHNDLIWGMGGIHCLSMHRPAMV